MSIHLDCAATFKLDSGAMKMKIIRSGGEEMMSAKSGWCSQEGVAPQKFSLLQGTPHSRPLQP